MRPEWFWKPAWRPRSLQAAAISRRAGGDLLELIGGGALEVVFPEAETEAFDSVLREGAERGLGVFLADAGDVGGGELEVEAAAAEGGGKGGDELGRALGLDLALGADGAFDAVPADLGDVGGGLLGVEFLKGLGERDEREAGLRGGRCGGAGADGERGGGDGGLGEEGAAGEGGSSHGEWGRSGERRSLTTKHTKNTKVRKGRERVSEGLPAEHTEYTEKFEG